MRNRTFALLSEVSSIAEGIAKGDLNQKIDTTDSSEEGRLLRVLNTMQEKLADVVSTIRSSAETIATASSEIAQVASTLVTERKNKLVHSKKPLLRWKN